MRFSTAGRLFTAALAVFASACIDFDQYAEGGGQSAGGAPAGGAPVGGAGGSAPTCPSDDTLPATVCITESPYLFDAPFSDDWKGTQGSVVGLGCTGSCARITGQGGRSDVRTVPITIVNDCFLSIDVLDNESQRVFLELVPDSEGMPNPLPPPRLADRVEIAVANGAVALTVPGGGGPAIPLGENVVVDQLRIQVRQSTVVLEAFSGGEQVACSEQPRPEVLSQPVRAGFGIDGASGEQTLFDNYGLID